MHGIGALLFLAAPVAQDARVALLTLDGIDVSFRDERRFVEGSAGAETFAWDRDGAHLLVTRGGTLERLALVGGERVLVRDGWAAARMPDVSPDGERIVLAVQRAAGTAEPWEVVVMERSSGEVRALGSGYDPCFSRDGAAVFCERYPERDLWCIDLDTGDARRAFEDAGDRYTVQADPFEERLAFSSRGSLVLRPLDGAPPRVLSPAGVYDRFASFTPDGTAVLFFRQVGEERSIRVLDLDGGEETLLAAGDVQLAAFEPPTLDRFVEQRGDPPPRDGARDPELAAALARTGQGQHLCLPAQARLAPVEAWALARFRGSALSLPALAHLEPASASALARFEGSLFLDGLRTLEPSAAGALAAWRGNGEQVFLSLDGLAAPEPDALSELARCRGWGISLGGLRELSVPQARALAPLACAWLDLDGVERVSPEVAEEMAGWRVKFLSLRGWRDADDALLERVRAGCALLIR